MEIHYGLNEVEKVAKQLLNQVSSKIIVLYGSMGVGKTTLIKALVKALGSDDDVSSPTFSIVNEYRTGSDVIYHFDLYRIEDIEEAYNFGIEDYLDADAWIFIEWPEHIVSILPEFYEVVHLELSAENDRILKLDKTYNPNKSNKLV